MGFAPAVTILKSSTASFSHHESPATRTHLNSSSSSSNSTISLVILPNTSPVNKTSLSSHNPCPIKKNQSSVPLVLKQQKTTTAGAAIPTMSDILEASARQNLDLQLQTFGPFFRITARRRLEPTAELGRAEGLIRPWVGGKILHLDSIRLRRETLGMEKSIFGIGLFIGAVAVRFGYDCGCKKAELLAIYDTDLYHSKDLNQDGLT